MMEMINGNIKENGVTKEILGRMGKSVDLSGREGKGGRKYQKVALISESIIANEADQ